MQLRWADGGAAEVHGQEEGAAEVGRMGVQLRCMGRRRVQPGWADGGAAEVHGQEEGAAEVECC